MKSTLAKVPTTSFLKMYSITKAFLTAIRNWKLQHFLHIWIFSVVCQKWESATELLTGIFINAGCNLMETV